MHTEKNLPSSKSLSPGNNLTQRSAHSNNYSTSTSINQKQRVITTESYLTSTVKSFTGSTIVKKMLDSTFLDFTVSLGKKSKEYGQLPTRKYLPFFHLYCCKNGTNSRPRVCRSFVS